MGSIQLALSDTTKAEALRALLARSARVPVECVAKPELERACAVVVDPAHMNGLARPLSHPERVVLVTPGDEQSLQDAWDLGVSSVVNEQDPVNTVVLAVLAVCLRCGGAKEQAPSLEPEGRAARRESQA
jgi:hypothetical protein